MPFLSKRDPFVNFGLGISFSREELALGSPQKDMSWEAVRGMSHRECGIFETVRPHCFSFSWECFGCIGNRLAFCADAHIQGPTAALGCMYASSLLGFHMKLTESITEALITGCYRVMSTLRRPLSASFDSAAESHFLFRNNSWVTQYLFVIISLQLSKGELINGR